VLWKRLVISCACMVADWPPDWFCGRCRGGWADSWPPLLSFGGLAAGPGWAREKKKEGGGWAGCSLRRPPVRVSGSSSRRRWRTGTPESEFRVEDPRRLLFTGKSGWGWYRLRRWLLEEEAWSVLNEAGAS